MLVSFASSSIENSRLFQELFPAEHIRRMLWYSFLLTCRARQKSIYKRIINLNYITTHSEK